MTIYLYVKTHRKTGLKYLGKTVNQNPHTYQGSGKVWRRHIKKHGYDCDTDILLETDDSEQIKVWGKYYSDLWNIVESNDWANLMPETGDGGAVENNYFKVINSNPMTEKQRRSIGRSMKGNRNSAKKVLIDGVIYGSMKEAGEAYSRSAATINYWIKRGKAEYV